MKKSKEPPKINSFDVIVYPHGTWVVHRRGELANNHDVMQNDAQTWVEIDSDNPKDAMIQGYDKIQQKGG